MKTLFFDCSMGAAGDMIMSALYELIDGKEAFIRRMNALGIPGVSLTPQKKEKRGIAGTHIAVLVGGEEEGGADAAFDGHGHSHTGEHKHGNSLADIEQYIRSLPVSEGVREDAAAVYRLLADAESRAHGKPVDNIHFHEVGTMDALADIVGVCILMEQLSPEKVTASPVHVGSGHVRCAHGILPVPAPATAHILTGVPIYGGAVNGELCTPTGAALLKHFVVQYGDMPSITVDKIGYGMGTKDFETANCFRAFIGEAL